MDPRTGALEAILRAAGKLALRHFGKVAVERKPDRSVVTEADREVERFLISQLAELEPGARFLGEEGTSVRTPGGAAATWAIDPIDGTAVFIAGLPTWALSVGLIRNGVPVLGGVYLPVGDEMYVAGEDGPLHWNGREIDRRLERGLTEDGIDSESWIGFASNHHRRFHIRWPAKVRSLGSAAAQVAWAARGAAVAAIGSARLWDVAGGLACCRAAGVAWCYLSGRPVDLSALLEGERTPEPLLVAHPADLARVREMVEIRAAGSAPRPGVA